MDTSIFKKHKGFYRVPTTLSSNFWPPELHGDLSDEKLDIWCLGVLSFLMITGKYPFPKDEIYEDLNYQNYQGDILEKKKI